PRCSVSIEPRDRARWRAASSKSRHAEPPPDGCRSREVSRKEKSIHVYTAHQPGWRVVGTEYSLPPEVDLAIVGAGPVGLALAIELSRLELTTLVVDRRPPPAEDALRPQMLVARAGDLAHLARLGVDLDVVSMLTARCQTDAVS